MTILASWASGALPAVTGDVTSDPAVGVPTIPALKIASTATTAYARWTIASQDYIATSFYIRTPTTWPTTSVNIAAFRPTGGTISLGLALSGSGAPGQLRVTKSSGNILNSPAGTLAVATDYYVEVTYNAATTTATARVRPAGSAAWLWSNSVTDAALSTPVVHVDYGRVNTTPLTPDFWLDSITVATDPADLGPDPDEAFPPPPAGNDRVQVWNGTSLVPATVYVWTGTVLAPVADVGIWDGTTVQPTAAP